MTSAVVPTATPETSTGSTGVLLAEAIAAARKGDVASLRAWHAVGGDPVTRDVNGLTPVHHAAVCIRPEALRLLLDALPPGAPRDAVLLPDATTFLPSPLHLAAQGNATETASILLAAAPSGIDHVWGLNGHTPLLEAAFVGGAGVAKLLFVETPAGPADTSAVALGGLTASNFTVRAAAYSPAAAEIFDRLNARNHALGYADQAETGDSPRYDIDAEEKHARLRRLFAQVEPHPRPSTPDAERLLVLAGATIPLASCSAKARAAFEAELVQNVRSLLDGPGRNIDLDAPIGSLGTTTLIAASIAGNLPLVAELIARGADPMAHELHPMEVTALFKAAVYGRADIVALLLDHIAESGQQQLEAAINETGRANGFTPLHDAELWGHQAIADLLIARGARADIEDFAGRTAAQLIAARRATKA